MTQNDIRANQTISFIQTELLDDLNSGFKHEIILSFCIQATETQQYILSRSIFEQFTGNKK